MDEKGKIIGKLEDSGGKGILTTQLSNIISIFIEQKNKDLKSLIDRWTGEKKLPY